MAAISQQLADITVLSIVVRILLSTFCAGTLGFERERHNQAAGFRTYIIVSDASALVMMTNIFVAGIGETDLVRMSASVITGLGFLGAGTILVTGRQEVKGLTTAAGLWASACMGLAIGAGFYECMIVGFILIFLCMRILPLIENAVMAKARNMNIYVEMDSVENVGAIVSLIKSENITLYDLEIDKEQHEHLTQINAVFSLHLPHKEDHTEVLARLSTLDGIITIEEV